MGAPAVQVDQKIPENISVNTEMKNQIEKDPDVEGKFSFQPPLDRASERVTKKPFGIFITPQNSPVSPERFYGYHTGADFEVFPEELYLDVEVKAICSGELKMKKTATGYGGLAAEACEINGDPITVIYGHLKLSSIAAKVGENLKSGDTLGILGKGFSSETNGERKHLHLGIHKGTAINILGYVQSKENISDWIDPCLYACGK
ncbi:MAG: hypothetical protein A3J63_00770 [Candidatus Moranbacteria bacterium RIFCSPHIGHO2_02_FULL_40_12b]|nr:MAG: hypothetical protein A3J63_00770 [Candidatus Moranbacteria bacterium RIFCSPHIGHO2_02_FULL_40_12b]